MKNLIVIFVFCTIYAISTSCEKMFGDFLDKAPGSDVTEDSIFSSVSQAEIFLASCYNNGMYAGYGYSRYYYGSTKYSTGSASDNAFNWAAASDEGDYPKSWYWSNQWNSGSLVPYNGPTSDGGIFDNRYDVRWTALRMFYTMLEKVDGVPGIDPAYASQIKGEMKFLVALNYLEMLKRYGGVPIVRRRILIGEDFIIRRSSVDSTVQFIVKNCDEAAAVLPDAWPSNWNGRITKGAALACKAKTLLYAARPLFNTETPYLDMDNPADNRLICYTNYNVNRWKDAADAAKAVLDWATAGGIKLVTDQGVDKNYKYVWEVYDNPEIILADKQTNGPVKANYNPWVVILPMAYGGWSTACPTQTFIEKFYDNADGTPQAPWGTNGTDLNQRYANLEPRFKQSVGYNGAFWNTANGYLENYLPNGLTIQECNTGYFVKKFVPDVVNNANSTIPINWTIFRLAEFYLSYAEALNEYNASPPAAAYTAVNAIRTRSGMPDLPTGLTKDQFRERVIKEWAVEYFYEDRRFWDLRFWLQSENVLNGPIYGLKIYKFGTGTPQEFSYERYAFETRFWKRKYYLHPFYISEVNKGYIVQNPGW